MPQQQPEQAKASDTISSGTQRVEWQVPVKRESDCLQREAAATAASASAAAAPAPATQVHPGQGPASVQHVTMDKSGKGEGISNTVGEWHQQRTLEENLCQRLYNRPLTTHHLHFGIFVVC